jgi:hypothetical protein
MLNVRVRLEPEDGAGFLRALEVACERFDRDVSAEASQHDVRALAPTFEEELATAPPHEQRRADALCLMAEAFLNGSSAEPSAKDAERALVVVHVDGEGLDTSDGRCDLGDGRPAVPPETARRLACDATLLRVSDGPGGAPLSVGRRTRVVPRGMRRALLFRDRGCRFPGCSAHRRVDAHHIRHWANGGETALSNLVLLCRTHHRAVHEDGFTIRASDNGSLTFRRPDGLAIDEVPSPARAHTGGVVTVNRRSGLAITPTTCATLSYYAPNYDDAVEGLLRLGCADP